VWSEVIGFQELQNTVIEAVCVRMGGGRRPLHAYTKRQKVRG
jgi:hypothetical protein